MKTIAELNLVVASLVNPEIFNDDNFLYFEITATCVNGNKYTLHYEDHKIVKVEKYEEAC